MSFPLSPCAYCAAPVSLPTAHPQKTACGHLFHRHCWVSYNSCQVCTKPLKDRISIIHDKPLFAYTGTTSDDSSSCDHQA